MTNKLSEISPKRLAMCAGIHENFAWQITTGRRKLPVKYVPKVSAELGIPMKDLRPDLASVMGASRASS